MGTTQICGVRRELVIADTTGGQTSWEQTGASGGWSRRRAQRLRVCTLWAKGKKIQIWGDEAYPTTTRTTVARSGDVPTIAGR